MEVVSIILLMVNYNEQDRFKSSWFSKYLILIVIFTSLPISFGQFIFTVGNTQEILIGLYIYIPAKKIDDNN